MSAALALTIAPIAPVIVNVSTTPSVVPPGGSVSIAALATSRDSIAVGTEAAVSRSAIGVGQRDAAISGP
jgi:hypothetical protein